MLRLLLISILHSLLVSVSLSQSLSVNDLLAISSLSPKNFDSYMNKKGFVSAGKSMLNDAMATSFFAKIRKGEKNKPDVSRSVDLYKQDDTYCFALHTSSFKEYMDGRNQLSKAGFFCGNKEDTGSLVTFLYQKRNICVQANAAIEDEQVVYTFLLQKKELPNPASVEYADDLLKFNSHEYLVSFFGENVKKDVYYFSEKELKKCSVLFPNTSQQAVFIWDDEVNMQHLSYILISGILPTLSAVQYSGNVSQNKWVLKNGIYSGMKLKELLRINENDFQFYGRNSEFAFMVDPQSPGNIDFKKAGIMLGCIDCNGSSLLNNAKVSAADAIKNSLSLHIFYIMISP